MRRVRSPRRSMLTGIGGENEKARHPIRESGGPG
jgi:hypothetical protein